MKPPCQRGLSTLVMVLGLFLVTALAAAFANRHLLVELRTARLVGDGLRAQVAAEQGIERALSLLNGDAIDGSCRPSPTGGRSAVERWLQLGDQGQWTPRQSGTDPSSLVCDRALDGEWDCRCADAQPPLEPPAAATASSSVRVTLGGLGAPPGHLWVRAHGCGQASAGCAAPGRPEVGPPTTGHQTQMQLALLPALRQTPSTALLVVGAADLGDGMAVVNTDAAAGGVALRAGGPLRGQRSALLGPNGALPSDAWAADDAELQSLGPHGTLRRLLGLPLPALNRLPAVRVLRCANACDANGVAALLDQGARFVWVDGPLRVDRAVHWGQRERPVLLVVSGALDWAAPSRFVGALLVGGDARLAGGLGQARFDGAVVVGGNAQGGAQTQIVHHAEVLRRLQHGVGSFLRVPGSVGDAS